MYAVVCRIEPPRGLETGVGDQALEAAAVNRVPKCGAEMLAESQQVCAVDRTGQDSPVAGDRIADQECPLQAHRRRALVRNCGGEVCDAGGESADPRRAGGWLR